MAFNFTGATIGIYRTTSNNMSSSTVHDLFTLDSGTPVPWSRQPNPIPLYGTLLFSRHGLEDGRHTLIMEATVENSETWIDYIEVDSASTPLSSTPSKPTSIIASDVPTAKTKHGHSPGIVAGIARQQRAKERSRNAEAGQMNQTNSNVAPWSLGRNPADALNPIIQPFPLFTSNVEMPRKHTENPSSSGAVSQSVADPQTDGQGNMARLDDPPPSYAVY
ncbi:hypothetical protein PQX77_006713 [Marasmius sp. AFHP31]|nr:hypothetical protein PQX77_006713 [Marasmius sp. AFHP31]